MGMFIYLLFCGIMQLNPHSAEKIQGIEDVPQRVSGR